MPEPAKNLMPETHAIPAREISDPSLLSADPLVSIPMLAYNHEPYIAQAIEGILQQQTDFPVELVIGEDCSTDRTREIVLRYQREHPDVIRVITAARNVGMHENGARTAEACRGRYVAFCEGDDFWHHPEKLQKQVDYLETHPQVGLVHSDYHCLLAEEGTTIHNYVRAHRHAHLHDIRDVFSGLLLGQYWIATCTVCARRELVAQAHQRERDVFTDRRVLLGDLPCWLSMCRRCEFFFIEESLATYRIRAESASRHRSRVDALRFHESSQRVRLLLAERYDCPPAVRAAVRTRYYRVVLNEAYHAGDGCLARDALSKLRETAAGICLHDRLFLLGATNRLARAALAPFLRLRRGLLRLRKAHALNQGENARWFLHRGGAALRRDSGDEDTGRKDARED